MRRFVVLAFTALIGCNAILGIESASVDPTFDGGVDAVAAEPELDAGNRKDAARVDAATPDPPRPDAGDCVDMANNPRHCGACNHDCGPGTCVESKCQAGVVATGFAGKGGALLVTSTHVYHGDFDTGILSRSPIYGGVAALMFDPGGSDGFDSPIGHNLVAIGDYIYFIDRPRSRVARCPLLGACTPETIIADFPKGYSLATANGDLYAADGVFGKTIVLCTAPPCAEKKVIISGEDGLMLIAASNTDLAWATLNANGKVTIKTKPLGAGVQQTLLELPGAGLLGTTSLVVSGRDIHLVLLGDLYRYRLPSTTQEALGDIGPTESLRYDGLSYWYGDYGSGNVYQRSTAPDAGSYVVGHSEGHVMDMTIHPTGIYWATETEIWRRVR